jgi:hypothetical protein
MKITVYPTSPARQAEILRQVNRLDSPPTMRGLGDVIARATSAVGIKPCGGCKQRQEKLNRLVPFGTKES